MFIVGVPVAKVATRMLRENNRFMLVFDLTVAEVAWFLGVHGDCCINVYGWIVGSKSS